MSRRSPPATVTAIVPAHQAERFLADAVASILSQRPAVAEILVVDDGSTDGTAEIARGLPEVRLVRQPPSGAGAARNAGGRAARGEFLAFLDHDDLWLAGKLEAQLAAFEAEPSLDGVFTAIRNAYTAPELEQRYRSAAGDRVAPHASTLLVRRASFLRAPPFDESLARAEFADWYARAVDAGLRFRVLEDLFAVRRIHGANTSIRLRADGLDFVRMARARIAARRRRGSRESD
jgi:glycosyltransferase involved in cell wall biosynthesis